MKIALVNHTFSLSHGGLERVSVNLATALSKEGHEVHVFAHRLADMPEGIVGHFVPVKSNPSFQRVLSFHKNVGRALRAESFDVIYGLTRFLPLDIYRMGDGVQRHWMRLRYPFFLWRWMNYLVNPVHLCHLFLEKSILKGVDTPRIITNSQLVKRHAQKYYDVAEGRIRVIYNGVDHEVFNPASVTAGGEKLRRDLGISPDDLAVLYVSNNWKRKGLKVLLEAVSLLGDRGSCLHVIVVGRGKPGPFKKLADRLGLGGRVHIVGETDQVQNYYGAGDLFVLPTLYDPFSNVCLEAMACGLPVITTAENGASELIASGENGFVQKNPKDAEELAGLLRSCLDRTALVEMGQAARKTSLTFDWERTLKQTLEICRQVQGEKRS